MKKIETKKIYTSIDEINNSEEFQAMWAGLRIQPLKNYPEAQFVKGFLTADNKIFTIREMKGGKDDGLLLLKKEDTVSCLTNRPFHAGYVSYENTINIDMDSAYDRCNQNRITFAKTHKEIMATNPENYKTIPFVTTL